MNAGKRPADENAESVNTARATPETKSFEIIAI